MSADLIGDDACREAFNKARQQRFSVHGLDVVCEPDIFRAGYAAGRDSEIAKRDARMAELEKELQAGATAVENCELFRAELAAIKAPARDITAMVDAAMIEMANISPPMRRNECERLIRAALNATPVQQVSVPDGWRLVPDHADADAIVTALYRRFKDWAQQGFGPEDVTWCEVKADILAMLAAAPAAPAADAGMVEALTELVSAANSVNKSRAHEVRGLQDDEPCYWQRKEWVDWLVTLGERGRDALAAHSAKGVV